MGEVRSPGRYELLQPTSALQAIALAGGWNHGCNLRQIVIFRRTEDWCLLATKFDLARDPHGTQSAAVAEIWLRDSDVVVVPKKPTHRMDDALKHVFGCGSCCAWPLNHGNQFATSSMLTGP